MFVLDERPSEVPRQGSPRYLLLSQPYRLELDSHLTHVELGISLIITQLFLFATLCSVQVVVLSTEERVVKTERGTVTMEINGKSWVGRGRVALFFRETSKLAELVITANTIANTTLSYTSCLVYRQEDGECE